MEDDERPLDLRRDRAGGDGGISRLGCASAPIPRCSATARCGPSRRQTVKKGKLACWPSAPGRFWRMVPMLTPRSPEEATKLCSVPQGTGLDRLGRVEIAGDRVEADRRSRRRDTCSSRRRGRIRGRRRAGRPAGRGRRKRVRRRRGWRGGRRSAAHRGRARAAKPGRDGAIIAVETSPGWRAICAVGDDAPALRAVDPVSEIFAVAPGGIAAGHGQKAEGEALAAVGGDAAADRRPGDAAARRRPALARKAATSASRPTSRPRPGKGATISASNIAREARRPRSARARRRRRRRGRRRAAPRHWPARSARRRGRRGGRERRARPGRSGSWVVPFRSGARARRASSVPHQKFDQRPRRRLDQVRVMLAIGAASGPTGRHEKAAPARGALARRRPRLRPAPPAAAPRHRRPGLRAGAARDGRAAGRLRHAAHLVGARQSRRAGSAPR